MCVSVCVCVCVCVCWRACVYEHSLRITSQFCFEQDRPEWEVKWRPLEHSDILGSKMLLFLNYFLILNMSLAHCLQCVMSVVYLHWLNILRHILGLQVKQKQNSLHKHLDVEQLKNYHRKTDDALCNIHHKLLMIHFLVLLKTDLIINYVYVCLSAHLGISRPLTTTIGTKATVTQATLALTVHGTNSMTSCVAR